MKKGNYVIGIISIFFTALLYSTTFLLPAFANEVQEQVLIVFDLDDESGYEDFYKITIDKGSIITKKPENPEKEGYVFTGWFSYLDENDHPVLWKFDSDIVEHNMTLWACWEEDKNTISSSNSETEKGPATENNSGAENDSKKETNSSAGETEITTNKDKDQTKANRKDSKENENHFINNEVDRNNHELDDIPKTGEMGFSMIYSFVSAVVALTGLVILHTKK